MSISSYRWDFSFIWQYTDAIGKGLIVTLELSILTIVFATLIGTLLGILMSRKNSAIRYPTMLLVDIIRSIPVIVLILLVYYLFPVFGLNRVMAFWPAVTALIINNSAFLGDIIRGSIEGLPKGSIIAAKSLGMSKLTTLKRIILPEVYREIFPSVVFSYIDIIKITSLASIIAVNEVTHIGEWIISATFKPLEVYLVVTLMYIIVILPLTLISRRLEKSKYFKRRSV